MSALDKARAARDDMFAVAHDAAWGESGRDRMRRNRALIADLLAEHGRLTALYPFSEKRPKTDNAPPTDDEREALALAIRESYVRPREDPGAHRHHDQTH